MYEPILVAFGGTLGQRIMGLSVVHSQSYQSSKEKRNINPLFSFYRYIAKLLLGWISLLTIHSDQYGRVIHDKVGNSIMAFR